MCGLHISRAGIVFLVVWVLGLNVQATDALDSGVNGKSARDSNTVISTMPKSGEAFLTRAQMNQQIESLFFESHEPAKVSHLKDEIRQLLREVKQLKDENPEKALVLKKLGDAYYQYAKLLRRLASRLNNPIVVAKQNQNYGAETKMRGQRKALLEKADTYHEKTIKAYVEIRNNFPVFSAYDEVLFLIGFHIEQLALLPRYQEKAEPYRERSRVFFKEIIQRYPQSRFVPAAWFYFGEYYLMTRKDADFARRAYLKVLERGLNNNPLYPFADRRMQQIEQLE